jgi:hopanoid C-3 methylase
MTAQNRETGFRPRRQADELDDLPLPDRELTRRYRQRYHHGFSVPSACVETSRGCPFDCNFCSVWAFYERRARRFSPERVLEDLQRVQRAGAGSVLFTDDVAFLNREHYEGMAGAIERSRVQLHYSSETRADLVVKHQGLFERWRRIGMDTVFLGIEKFDDSGLDAVRKRTKRGASTNIEAIDTLRRCGITPMTSLITDPAWDEKDFDLLEELVKALALPNPTFSILTPLPGTELWESLAGELTTDDYSYFDVIHLVLPARLGPRRFYERFAHLYRLSEARTHLGWQALRSLARLSLHGHGWVMPRIHSAVSDLRKPERYSAYPGTLARPAFVPPDFGCRSWVRAGRSYLARSPQSIAPAGSAGVRPREWDET